MNKILICFGVIFTTVLLSCCFDDDIVLDPVCAWNVTLESNPIDSCFDRPVTAQGMLLDGELEGRSIWLFTNDQNNADIFYYINKETSTGPAELYRLDLCNGEEKLLDNFSSFKGIDLRINGQNKVIYRDFFDYVSLYDIATQENIQLSNIAGIDVSWLNDSLFICKRFIVTNNENRLAWISYKLDGTPVDTLQLEFSTISNQNDNLVTLNAPPDQEDESCFLLYDVSIGEVIGEYTFPRLDMNTSHFLSYWINENEILVYTSKAMGIYNISTNQFSILRENTECDNLSFTEVAACINQPDNFLYLVRQNRYNDLNEYKLSFDLVRFNLETQEEVKVIF